MLQDWSLDPTSKSWQVREDRSVSFKARELASASPQTGSRPRLTRVEYPMANRVFDQQDGPYFRQVEAEDSQRRAVASIRKHAGDPPKSN